MAESDFVGDFKKKTYHLQLYLTAKDLVVISYLAKVAMLRGFFCLVFSFEV